MTYPNAALTAACELLLDDFELTQDQIAALASDLPGECEAITDNRAEAAWQRAYDPETIAARNDATRQQIIDAGRGHLLEG